MLSLGRSPHCTLLAGDALVTSPRVIAAASHVTLAPEVALQALLDLYSTQVSFQAGSKGSRELE